MIVECVVAIYSGLAAWSLALLAFGGDSLVELLSSFVVVKHLTNILQGRGGSIHHVESKRAEWVTVLLLFSLIPVIGLASVYSFLSGIRPEASLLGIAVAIAAVLFMPVLWYEKKRLGKATDCLPLTIDASESATCFLMSAALLAGLVVNYFMKIYWADYVATAFILIFVAKEASESIQSLKGVGLVT
jgi:divalent metal cation (Fe/Co/Zn/Cd) transporter